MDDKMYKKPTLIDDVEIYLNLFPIGLVQFLIHLTSDQKNMVNQRSNQLVLIIPIVKWSLSGVAVKLLMQLTALLQLVEVLQHYIRF